MELIHPNDEDLYNSEEEANNDPVYLLDSIAFDIDRIKSLINNNIEFNIEQQFNEVQNNITRAIELLEPEEEK